MGPSQVLTAIELFSGIGGMSLGFEMAGFRVLAGVEKVDQLRAAFQGAHPTAVTDFSDVATLDGRSLLKRLGLRKGQLDILIGGPPCQAFSTAGKRRGSDDERGLLIAHFVRMVAELRPRAFLMENVVGLLSIHLGTLIAQVVRDLSALGYEVAPPATLNAADFGVPQLRRRVFLAGIRGTRKFEFPQPTHYPIAAPLFPTLMPYVTVREAISDLPLVSATAALQRGDRDSIPYRRIAANAYQAQMRGRRQAVTGNGVSIHQPHIVEAISLLGPGETEPRTRYRRLFQNRPSFTLRAGSGTFTALRPIHPKLHRVITVREAARLQSFPDHVEFSDSKRSAYQEIGNSVPPLLARAIAARLGEFLS